MISHRLGKHDGHGAGEREGRVVAGDKTDKVWEGGANVCETPATLNPISIVLH